MTEWTEGPGHPTPSDIRVAIASAITRDDSNPDTPRIPVHVFRLVEDAISDECRRYDQRNAK